MLATNSLQMPHSTNFVIALALASFAGCTGNSSRGTAPAVTPQQQASASKSMGLAFPAGTHFLFYHRASEDRGLPGPDDAVHLKIDVPAAELPKFLAQAPLASAKWTSTGSPLTDVTKWPAWQPSKIKQFRSEQFQLPKGQGLNMLIDDSGGDRKVIYLHWFET